MTAAQSISRSWQRIAFGFVAAISLANIFEIRRYPIARAIPPLGGANLTRRILTPSRTSWIGHGVLSSLIHDTTTTSRPRRRRTSTSRFARTRGHGSYRSGLRTTHTPIPPPPPAPSHPPTNGPRAASSGGQRESRCPPIDRGGRPSRHERGTESLRPGTPRRAGLAPRPREL